MAKTVYPELQPAVQQAEFWAVVGRALVAEKKTRDRAVRVLVRAEQLAPQRIRVDPIVRETVAGLLAQGPARRRWSRAARSGLADGVRPPPPRG